MLAGAPVAQFVCSLRLSSIEKHCSQIFSAFTTKLVYFNCLIGLERLLKKCHHDVVTLNRSVLEQFLGQW